jgi:hypothetical protein
VLKPFDAKYWLENPGLGRKTQSNAGTLRVLSACCLEVPPLHVLPRFEENGNEVVVVLEFMRKRETYQVYIGRVFGVRQALWVGASVAWGKRRDRLGRVPALCSSVWQHPELGPTSRPGSTLRSGTSSSSPRTSLHNHFPHFSQFLPPSSPGVGLSSLGHAVKTSCEAIRLLIHSAYRIPEALLPANCILARKLFLDVAPFNCHRPEWADHTKKTAIDFTAVENREAKGAPES